MIRYFLSITERNIILDRIKMLAGSFFLLDLDLDLAVAALVTIVRIALQLMDLVLLLMK